MLKSPTDYLTDEQYDALAPEQRAVHVARSMDAVREQGGNNKGPWVAKFLKAVGLGPGYAWCAAFVTWCLRQAGYIKFPAHPASVIGWYAWAKDAKRLRQLPSRGRLFFWLDGSQGHIGFCLSGLAGDTFRTLEGNTGKAGSRDGDGVYEKVRDMSELKKHEKWGFIDLG